MAELASARQRWARHGPAAYGITVTRDCECLPEASDPVRISVRAGAVEARTYVGTGRPVPTALRDVFPSVEELFERIAGATRRRAARVIVRYDPVLGYPTRVFIDENATIVDDEITYVLTDFLAR